MKTSHPSPLTIVNIALLLLLIYLTLGNRKVGEGNAARLDSQRVIYEMQAAWQRRQANRLIDATAERWKHLFIDNPRLRPQEVKADDLREPVPTPSEEIDTTPTGK